MIRSFQSCGLTYTAAEQRCRLVRALALTSTQMGTHLTAKRNKKAMHMKQANVPEPCQPIMDPAQDVDVQYHCVTNANLASKKTVKKARTKTFLKSVSKHKVDEAR